MGQKTHPIGFRLGISQDWHSQWFATGGQYAKLIQEDLKIREMVREFCKEGGVSKIEIARDTNEIIVTIRTSRPGAVVGRSGKRIDELREHLHRLTGGRVRTNVHEIRTPELNAHQMAHSIASQLEARVSYRRALRNAIQRTMQAGAKGIKITVSGRLGGVEIARTDTQAEGSIPLSTLAAKIDYAVEEARTTYGVIGVKVWIYADKNVEDSDADDRRARRSRRRREADSENSKSERGDRAASR